MKAVVRSDKGVEYVALLSNNYDDAVQECLELLKENEELNAKGAKFSIHTDIAYGKGINGIGYNSYVMYEERGEDRIPKTKVYRTFEPKDAYVVIHEKFVHPEIPWNKNIKAGTCEYNVYIAYDRITYINETIKTI